MNSIDLYVLFRPISVDTAQSSMNNHFDPINGTSSNQQIELNSLPYSTAQKSTHLLEEPIVFKLNIPIEMIFRTIPQQLPSSS